MNAGCQNVVQQTLNMLQHAVSSTICGKHAYRPRWLSGLLIVCFETIVPVD